MDKANAIIRKVGDQYCVFSEDGTKKLGCSNTREEAIQRLQQVEYFKHKGKSDMSYDEFFDNLSIADMKPESVNIPSNIPHGEPHQSVNIQDQPLAKTVSAPLGTIAGHTSQYLLDQRQHFPVITEIQARSSMNRVMQLTERPAWYSGSLDDLRYEVYKGVMASHPQIDLKIPVSIQKLVVALSDGQEDAETKLASIKNPEDKLKSKVPQEKRPSIAGLTTEEMVSKLYAKRAEFAKAANIDGVFDGDEMRQVFAGDLISMLEAQEAQLENAIGLAKRLMKKGISGEEFAGLISFLQEDILRQVLMQSTSSRRAELLARLKAK
jgi:hypothetical protein